MIKFKSFEQANKWLLKQSKEIKQDSIHEIALHAYKHGEPYIYEDTTKMYKTGRKESDFKKGLVRIKAPQVKWLYYTDPNPSKNMLAHGRWWETITRVFKGDWIKIIAKTAKRYHGKR